MRDDGISSAQRIFQALAQGRLSERTEALHALDDPGENVDRSLLRLMLADALNTRFTASQDDDAYQPEDLEVKYARPWLLSAWARLSTDDTETLAKVREHLDPAVEPNAWSRFWTLEGLWASGTSDVIDLVRSVRERERDTLVLALVRAIEASRGDREALEEIRGVLKEAGPSRWAMLRALIVVPIEAMVDVLAPIIREAQHASDTFDAIRALGRISPTSPLAEEAGRILNDFVARNRRDPKWDSTRGQALAALGALKVESTAPILVEELKDENPAIVQQAAQALPKVLPLRIAVARVVETAAKAGATGIAPYATALRWMERERVVEELGVLMASGAPDQQEICRALLSDIGGISAFEKLRLRADAVARYSQVLDKAEERIDELFQSSISEAQRGYRLATRMDLVVFCLGIILLGASAGVAMLRQGSLETWTGVSLGVAGGTGVLGVVYGILIADPRRKVQDAVDHLMNLKVIFLAYLRQLHQIDQAYTRFMIDDRPFTTRELSQFAQLIRATMAAAIESLHPGGTPTSKAQPPTTRPSPGIPLRIPDSPEALVQAATRSAPSEDA